MRKALPWLTFALVLALLGLVSWTLYAVHELTDIAKELANDAKGTTIFGDLGDKEPNS